MGMHWYPAGSSLNEKAQKPFVIKGGLAGQGKIPAKIEPGEVWSGIMKEA
jgi:hypothetical protein